MRRSVEGGQVLGAASRCAAVAWVARWKARARALKREVHALSLAYLDPRTPWYAKAFLALLVGYALSPIDLIPDFIPVLGYLDDLVLIPAGVVLVRRMVPPEVLVECRARAAANPIRLSRKNWVAAVVIVLIWILSLALAAWLLWRLLR